MNPEQLEAAVAALRNLVRVAEASIPPPSPGRRKIVRAAAEAESAMTARRAEAAFLAAGRAATAARAWVQQTERIPLATLREQWQQSISAEEIAAMRRDVNDAATALRTALDALVSSSARPVTPRTTRPTAATLPPDAARRAVAQLAQRASLFAAPDALMSQIATLAQRAETEPPDGLRDPIDQAWAELRAARPDVMRASRAIILGENRISRVMMGNDPPTEAPVVNRTWGWFHSPADVDAGRIEVDQAWASLARAVADARRRRAFTAAQSAVVQRFDDARLAWGRVSRQLGSSWWDRAAGSGANAVEEGAAKYAQARADLTAVGIDVRSAQRGDTTPGQQQSQARAQVRETTSDVARGFGAFFSDPKVLIALGVVAFFILRKQR